MDHVVPDFTSTVWAIPSLAIAEPLDIFLAWSFVVHDFVILLRVGTTNECHVEILYRWSEWDQYMLVSIGRSVKWNLGLRGRYRQRTVSVDWHPTPRSDCIVRLRFASGYKGVCKWYASVEPRRSEAHTSELQSQAYLVRRLLLAKKNIST